MTFFPAFLVSLDIYCFVWLKCDVFSLSPHLHSSPYPLSELATTLQHDETFSIE
jgi:hypothetical protein